MASDLAWAPGDGVRMTHCRRPARDWVAPSRVRKTRILPCGGRTGQKLGDRTSRRGGFGRVFGRAESRPITRHA